MSQAQKVAQRIRDIRRIYRESPHTHGMDTRQLNTWAYRMALSYAMHTVHAHGIAARIRDKTAKRCGYI